MDGKVGSMGYSSTAAPSSEDDELGISVEGDVEAGIFVRKIVDDDDDVLVPISHDVYNMFFVSKCFGSSFFYTFYVFFLKMALYTFLAKDAVELYGTIGSQEQASTAPTVVAAQFLMLPVAVAMQADLISTYHLIANIKYSKHVLDKHPYAVKWKFNFASFLRGVDGLYSLLINFVILMKATDVLTLFLNFAALQFLQQIDDIALTLAANGYLSDGLEEVAQDVMKTRLPKKHNVFFRALDSALFLMTLTILIIAWGVLSFALD